MKLILALIILSLAGLVVLSACNQPTKKRGEKVTTENRPVSSFNAIEVEGVFPVELSQDGGAEFVKVQTEESLQQYIKVTSTGNKLEIKLEEGASLNNPEKMKVYINIKDLKEMEYKSVGSLSTAGQLKV
ncbi:MAG: DUF2807 domain-containing protein, partial [Chitinophagales bacterium]|nr:DUF2807 domain-containing protein [Chitinophagales bacterium]